MDREAMISHLAYDPVSEWRFAYRGGPPPVDASPGWQKMLEEQKRLWHWHHEGEGRGVVRALLALYATLEDPPRADPLDSEGGRALVDFIQRAKSVSDHTILFVTPWHPAYRKTGADRAEMEQRFERLAEITQVTLLKETYDEPSLTPEYFFDIDHLNTLGRERFSELLGARIQTLTAGSPAPRPEVP